MEEYKVYKWPDGREEWWLNGELHRIDGPALIWPDGYEAWFLNGKLHRTDGPAVIDPDGREEWYLNGQRLTKEEWERQVNQQSYDGKVVEVESKRYQLKEI